MFHFLSHSLAFIVQVFLEKKKFPSGHFHCFFVSSVNFFLSHQGGAQANRSAAQDGQADRTVADEPPPAAVPPHQALTRPSDVIFNNVTLGPTVGTADVAGIETARRTSETG